MSSVQYVTASISDNYMFYETSGVDCSQDIIMGRPYGGLAILYKRGIADKVKMVKTSNRRLCVLQIQYEGCLPILIVNVYMPCDNYSVQNLNSVYRDTISDIDMIMSDHTGELLLCGDWNTDTARNTAQVACFNEFIERNNLYVCWDNSNASRQSTYANYALMQFSCICRTPANCWATLPYFYAPDFSEIYYPEYYLIYILAVAIILQRGCT